MACWIELPGPCLQAIGSQLLTAEDAAAARLTCASWSRSIPVMHINVNLAGCSSCSSDKHGMQQHLQSIQALLACIQQQGAATSAARQFCVRVPAGGVAAASSAAPSSSGNDMNSALSPTCVLDQIALALPRLPALDRINIISSHVSHSLGSAAAAAAAPGVLASVLQPLLLQPQLQCSLTSLGLNLACWPAGQELAALLQQLQALRSLNMQQCPLAVICQLPQLPRLQQLSITGMVSEPVPAGYSFKRGPMLPQLPQLTSLQLRSTPLDLRVQELEGIEAAVRAAARQQHQQGQQCRPVLLGLPPALVCAAARSSTSSNTSCSTSSSSVWRRGQWVGSSIAAQCPALHELRSDLELGPAVLQLQHLTSLHGAHPAWLEAAAAEAAASCKADNALQQRQVRSRTTLLQLQQLQHLGIGVDTAADCHLLAQLTSLESLMAWSSSSCRQRRQQQQQYQQAASAAGKASSTLIACTSSRSVACTSSSSGGHCGASCGSAPSLGLVLGQGMGCSLSRLVVDGAWGVSSGEVEQVLQQCRHLKLLQVTARAC